MAEETASCAYADVQHSIHFFSVAEELLEDVLGIVSKTVPSSEPSLTMKLFFECFVPILIIVRSFDRIAENFVCLGHRAEHLRCHRRRFLGIFRMVTKCQFSILFCHLSHRSFSAKLESLLVFRDHVSSKKIQKQTEL
jgi:hypothetical protein